MREKGFWDKPRNAGEAIADVIIRIMEYSEGMGYRIVRAILAKAKFNETREHMHGQKF